MEDAIETVEAVQTIEEMPEQQPEQTEFIVYQEDIGGTEQYYTETIVSDNTVIDSGNFIKQPVPRIKNKRTVAAVRILNIEYENINHILLLGEQ